MTPEQLRISIIKDVLTGKLTQSKGEELKPIDNEYFDIYQVPMSWDIVTLEECCYIHARIGWQALRKDEHKKSGDYLLVTGTDFKNGLVDYSTCVYVSRERYEMDEKIQLQNDDILVTKDGSIGKVAVVKELPMPATLNAGVFVIRPDDRFDKKYIEYLFQCSYFTHFVNLVKSGTTIKHLNQNKLLKFMIPVPQIEEQREIVKVLEELLPYIDKFEILDNQVKQFNAKFPEDMKKSILQYAIQGKLVEQRPEEGTAEELYQQILDEKKKYKIKEFPVDDIGEVPFDIPETWKWVHLQDIVKKTIKRGKSPKYSEKSNVQVFAQKCNVKTGGINMGLAFFLDDTTIEKYPDEEYMLNGDIVINSTGGGTMGRVGVFHDTDRVANMPIVPDGHVTVIRSCDCIDYRYLYYFIKHNQRYFETQGEGSTNQTELKPITIASLLLPLPPLEEQHRIVEKIEKLLPYCDRLVK